MACGCEKMERIEGKVMEQEVRGMLGATPPEQLQTGDDMCQDLGGYADCCGASEAEPAGEYQPPSPELVQKYARKAHPGE